MLQRKYMEKNRSIARTVSIEAVLQPRFHYAVNYFRQNPEKIASKSARNSMKMLNTNVLLEKVADRCEKV